MKHPAWIAGIAAMMISSGCVSSRPIHYYALGELPSSVQMGGPDSPALVVSPVTASTALQDNRIWYRAGANEVGTYEYQRWIEPPGLLVRESLISALRSSGKYRSVQQAGSSSDANYSVRGRLDEWSEIDAGAISTRASLELELSDRKTGKLLLSKLYVRDEPVQGKEMANVVSSFERNLQQILREAVAEIGASIDAQLNNAQPRKAGVE